MAVFVTAPNFCIDGQKALLPLTIQGKITTIDS
jgi:hypothetical protein